MPQPNLQERKYGTSDHRHPDSERPVYDTWMDREID